MGKKYEQTVLPNESTTAGKLLQFVGYNKKVLEIGCASGVQSQLLKENFGCQITGIELDPEAAEKAGIYCDRIIHGDVENLNLKEILGGAQYDVILMADVLEHLKNPANVLLNIKSFFSENAYAVISVPNIVHAAVVYKMTHGCFSYTDYGLLDDGHIRFFTKSGIKDLLTKSGYKLDEMRSTICHPLETEINIELKTTEDKEAMTYLILNNDESLIYQFIIKARPNGNIRNETIIFENKLDIEQTTSLRNRVLKEIKAHGPYFHAKRYLNSRADRRSNTITR